MDERRYWVGVDYGFGVSELVCAVFKVGPEGKLEFVERHEIESFHAVSCEVTVDRVLKIGLRAQTRGKIKGDKITVGFVAPVERGQYVVKTGESK